MVWLVLGFARTRVVLGFSCCVWRCLISGWLVGSIVAWVVCCWRLMWFVLVVGVVLSVDCGLILVCGLLRMYS